MMLRELYQIGLQMRDAPDWPVPMYEERRIRWEIWLDEQGRLRPEGIKWFDPKDRELLPVAAPDITRANGVIPYLLVDKPEYVLGTGKNGIAQHEAYLELLRRCARETGNSDIRIVLEYLRSSKDRLLSELVSRGLGKENSGSQVQAQEWINFRVNGRCPIDDPAVQAWWADYARDELGKEEVCCISGVLGKVTRKFPVSIRLNGKNCKLASVDSPACKSYSFDKTDHAPMSHEAAIIAGTALKKIVEDESSCRQFGDTYYAFWTRDHTIRKGLSLFLSNDANDASVSEVKALFDSVFRGRRYNISNEDKFYMFVATNTETRVVIRASIEAALGHVVDNVRDWFDATSLRGPGSELPVPQALHKSLQVSNKRQNRSIGLSFVKRSLFAVPLGRPVYASVFPRIISRIHNRKAAPKWRCPSKEQVTVIKLYLSQSRSEVKELVALKEDYPDIAYHYGRLMAVYESIQIDASPNVQSTVTERFFSSMMLNPKRTVAKLDILSRSHLRKGKRDSRLGKGWEVNQSKRLQAINQQISALGAAECCTLSLDQRGLFVLGYWHEKFRTYNPNTDAKETNDDAGSEDSREDS